MANWIKANATGPEIFWNSGDGTLPLDIPNYTNGNTPKATAAFKAAFSVGQLSTTPASLAFMPTYAVGHREPGVPEAAERPRLRRGCYDRAVALARLGLICLDCEDPAGLAAFWAALLGGEVVPEGDDVVVVGNKGAPVAAVRVPGYQPPTWPGGAIPKQVHLDLAVGVGELDAAEAEAIRLGARRADEQPRPGDGVSCLIRPATRSACATGASRYRRCHSLTANSSRVIQGCLVDHRRAARCAGVAQAHDRGSFGRWAAESPDVRPLCPHSPGAFSVVFVIVGQPRRIAPRMTHDASGSAAGAPRPLIASLLSS